MLQRIGSLRALFGVVALCGLAAGCGNDSPESAGQPSAPARTKAEIRVSEIDEATKGMVKGVTDPSRPGAPVDLKFELKARPEIGQPLPIEIALLPEAPTDQLRATFIVSEALVIAPSREPAEFANVEEQTVHRYSLTVTPREEGVHSVSAIVLMNIDGIAEARTFSIPVLVGPPRELEPADAAGASEERK